MAENLTNFFIYVIIKEKGGLIYLEWEKKLGVGILMSNLGDEGWKARRKYDGTWKFKEFDIAR